MLMSQRLGRCCCRDALETEPEEEAEASQQVLYSPLRHSVDVCVHVIEHQSSIVEANAA